MLLSCLVRLPSPEVGVTSQQQAAKARKGDYVALYVLVQVVVGGKKNPQKKQHELFIQCEVCVVEPRTTIQLRLLCD